MNKTGIFKELKKESHIEFKSSSTRLYWNMENNMLIASKFSREIQSRLK